MQDRALYQQGMDPTGAPFIDPSQAWAVAPPMASEYGPQQNAYLPPHIRPNALGDESVSPAMPNPDHTFDPSTFRKALHLMGVGTGLGSIGTMIADPQGITPGKGLGIGMALGALPGGIAALGSNAIQRGNVHAANNEYPHEMPVLPSAHAYNNEYPADVSNNMHDVMSQPYQPPAPQQRALYSR